MANWPRCCGFLNLSGKKASRKASIYIKHVQELGHEENPTSAYTCVKNKLKERTGSEAMISNSVVVNEQQGVTDMVTDLPKVANNYENCNGSSTSNLEHDKDDEIVFRQSFKKNSSSKSNRSSERSAVDSFDSGRSPVPSILKNRRSPHNLKHDTLIPPVKSAIQVLLICGNLDPTFDSLKRASEKLSFAVTCTDSNNALEEFQSKSHDLIFIDTRSVKLDYDTICRSIRNTKGSQSVAIIAVAKRSDLERDEVIVPSLLDSGFNRCLIETTNVIQWTNELIQLKHGEVRLLGQQATTQALFAALDKCRDIIIITDDQTKMQYVNSAAESYFGYRYEELLGKTIHEQLTNDPTQTNVMSSKLSRGRMWTGPLTLRRKTLESVTVMCSGIPVNCGARSPTHFALVIDCGTIAIDLPRGSTTNLKRNSIDIRSVSSDYNRRTSIAKLSALPLEAPITKIIHLIIEAQGSAGGNNQLVATLDKVIEMLRCTELYSPQMKADNRVAPEESVATDLIGALISSNQPVTAFASRRSSNDSSVYRVASTKITSKMKMPTQIRDLLESGLDWDFDVIRLEDLSNKRPLLYLGMHIMLHFDIPGTLNIDERILYNFLMLIESKYHADNSYHNSSHAADVMQAVACYLERDRLKAIMDPLDEAVSLIAAACHDVDHPGRSSAFLSNCDNPLAVLYNDITVLENHHAALTFKLALGDDRVNIFKNLDRDTYKVVRQNIVDMILATEMTKHFEHLAKFVNVFSVKSSQQSIEHDETQGDYVPIALPENVLLVKRMMIKCADVSNPTRPLRHCVEWARRITEEYFQQTDEEKAKGLPVLMPMFDRTTCSIPKAQIGFVDFIINDMVEAWNGFIDFPELVTYMRQNYLKWKEYDEKGFTTLSDIKKLLMTGLSPSSSTTPTVTE